MSNLARLRSFIHDMTRLAERHGEDEQRMLDEGEKLLRVLIAQDDWLPEEYARPSPEGYRQYLLHCDPMERFSVVSFVWMPGQRTPIHDHTVWGLVGVMRGEEQCEEYSAQARPAGRHPVRRGEVDRVSPRIGDIHVVANEGSEVAVSIHVYGANIGAVRRHTYDPASGARRNFVSGYANASIPNLWDRSREA
ncbi:MAG: cysteine dioxygenase [Betaproteobacteria bacterium]|nr:cysteine dioxygenase [Betaproteobacteria bacterium]